MVVRAGWESALNRRLSIKSGRMRLAIAVVVGAGITALGFVLAQDLDVRWAGILLLPWPALEAVLPHPNVGTLEHPLYEGTPLDLPAAIIGLALSVVMNAGIAYAFLTRINRSSRSRRLSRAAPSGRPD